jgi:hypothetical protein
MDEALLFISGSSSGDANGGNGYEVIDYHFSSERDIDKKGQPASAVKAMVIEVEVYSSISGADLIGTMFDSYQRCSGRIEFYTNDPSGGRTKYKTLKFENAHMFKYAESFNRNLKRRMTETIGLTAGKVDIEGTSYTQEWVRSGQ